MVRFRYNRPKEDNDFVNWVPYYNDPWISYDPKDPSNCSIHYWIEVWQKDKDRDRLHRKNSGFYSREAETEGQDEVDFFQDSSVLALILFGTIIFFLFVPQIVDIILTVVRKKPSRPETPPTPPPALKRKKRFHLFHYAKPIIPEGEDRPDIIGKRKSIIGKDLFYYDPGDMQNYVSSTRINALLKYQEEARQTEEDDD